MQKGFGLEFFYGTLLLKLHFYSPCSHTVGATVKVNHSVRQLASQARAVDNGFQLALGLRSTCFQPLHGQAKCWDGPVLVMLSPPSHQTLRMRGCSSLQGKPFEASRFRPGSCPHPLTVYNKGSISRV